MSETLVTERLLLRPLVQADAAALHAIYSDAEAMRWWSHPPHTSEEQTDRKVAANLAASDWELWAITLDGAVIGTLAAHEKRQGGVFEIGYSLNRTQWRQGLAAEALRAWVSRLFEEGARRVFADTDPDNAGSNRLLERLGFTREGRLRAEWETHIGVRDSFIWGMLREEWQPDPQRG